LVDETRKETANRKSLIYLLIKHIVYILIKFYKINASVHITNLMRFGWLSVTICDTKIM